MTFAFGVATLLVASRIPETSLGQVLSMRVKVQNFAEFGCFHFAWDLIFWGCAFAYPYYRSRESAGGRNR